MSYVWMWIIRLTSLILFQISKSARAQTQNCNIIVNSHNNNNKTDDDSRGDGKYVWCQFAPLKVRPERWFRQFISTSCYHSSVCVCFHVCMYPCMFVRSVNLLCIHLCILSIPLDSIREALFIPLWMANSHNSQYKSSFSLRHTRTAHTRLSGESLL